MSRKVGLQTSPTEALVFTGDFLKPTPTRLTLSNSSPNAVHYRIKTTTPHRFVVKPYRGTVEANSTAVVDITSRSQSYKTFDGLKLRLFLIS